MSWFERENAAFLSNSCRGLGLVAGPLGFEPRVFGFLPPVRPEADALIRAGLRAPPTE
jgi:hypothetical protein